MLARIPGLEWSTDTIATDKVRVQTVLFSLTHDGHTCKTEYFNTENAVAIRSGLGAQVQSRCSERYLCLRHPYTALGTVSLLSQAELIIGVIRANPLGCVQSVSSRYLTQSWQP